MFTITLEVKGIRRIQKTLEDILGVLNSKFQPVGVKFVVGKVEERVIMNIGEQQAYLVNEIDVNGKNVVPDKGDIVTVVSSDETIVSLTPDGVVAPGSLASGFATAVKAGSVTLTATATKADGTALGTPKVINVDVVATSNGAVDITFTLNPIAIPTAP